MPKTKNSKKRRLHENQLIASYFTSQKTSASKNSKESAITPAADAPSSNKENITSERQGPSRKPASKKSKASTVTPATDAPSSNKEETSRERQGPTRKPPNDLDENNARWIEPYRRIANCTRDSGKSMAEAILLAFDR